MQWIRFQVPSEGSWIVQNLVKLTIDLINMIERRTCDIFLAFTVHSHHYWLDAHRTNHYETSRNAQNTL